MANIITAFQNWARAKVDHDLIGRFDLPIYNTGSDVFDNFISTFKGCSIYRAGFEDIYLFQDCAFVEFKYSATQNYIIVMYNTKMRFLSYASNGDFGWVESSPGNPLEVTTPYTLAQSKEIALGKPTQNFDVMVFTHASYQPYKLTRTSATTFTFLQFARKDDPFATSHDSSKTITNITQANPGVVTAVAHGYSTGDRVGLRNVVGMTQVNLYDYPVIVLTANTFSIGVDTTNYTAYSSAGDAVRASAFELPAQSLFYRGRLYYAATTAHPTTVWGSESANYDIFTLPATVTDASALKFTIADIAQKIEWLFGGDNSLIAGAADGIVAINGGSVGAAIKSDTVEAKLTSADGCNGAYPLRKDGYIFYAGRNGRNLYYFSYDLLTESFIAKDANFISYDITLGGITKIRHKKDRNDLVFGIRGDGDLLSLNFNAGENIIGWHHHDTEGTFKDIAQITDNSGNPQLFALSLRNGAYYIERKADYVEFKERSMFFTKPDSEFFADILAAVTLDNDAYNRYTAEQLKQCVYLDNALTYSDLRTATITYSAGTTITAGSSSFVIGDIGKHIVYKTATGYESGRFLITGYTSATVVTVEVLQTPTANVYTSWYLTFSSLSGLTQFNTYEVGVVTDGGYLDDFTISGGVLDLTNQYTHVVIGYKYKGLIKSFCMGFAIQGKNTQTTMKAIHRVGVRLVASAGGKIGTTPYRLAKVQELSQGNLNYLPPPLIDGTKYVNYSDEHELDKYFYVVQDEPLPYHLTTAMLETDYTISS